MIIPLKNKYETKDKAVVDSVLMIDRYIEIKGLDDYIVSEIHRFYNSIREVIETNNVILMYPINDDGENKVLVIELDLPRDESTYKVKEIFQENDQEYCVIEERGK